MVSDEAVLLVDWLNLSIQLKNEGHTFGAKVVPGLMKLAHDECAQGGLRFRKAHFAAESFGEPVKTAIRNTLKAEFHETRTAKEQADIQLAVLAMDHLHSPSGTPARYVLATGDQDFVPLIERVVEAGAQVTLVVASANRLSPEYLHIASQQGVKLVVLPEVIELDRMPHLVPAKQKLGTLSLVKVCMDGGVLGGDQSRNVAALNRLGIFQSAADAEEEYASWLRGLTREDLRRVAVPAKAPHGNTFISRRRTYLDFSKNAVTDSFVDADFVLRRTANPLRLPTFGELDRRWTDNEDGSRCREILDILKALGWISESAEQKFLALPRWASDGLLEPLWRVIAEVTFLSRVGRIPGVPKNRLLSRLESTPIAHDQTRKGSQAAQSVLRFAQSLGVIDALPWEHDGYVLSTIDTHPVVRSFIAILRTIRSLEPAASQTMMPESAWISQMSELDATRGSALFGYDTRDRQRVLRVLRRSRIVRMERTDSGNSYCLGDHPWLDEL